MTNRTKNSIMATMIALLGFSGIAMADMVDTFDGPDRDAAWYESNFNNSGDLIYTTPLAGTFEVTDMTDTNPGSGNYVQRTMNRLTNADGSYVSGDFVASMNLSWAQTGVEGMEVVKIWLYNSSGVVATCGFKDMGATANAKTSYSIGGSDIDGSSLALTGSEVFSIERAGNIYTCKMGETVLGSGAGSTDDITLFAIFYQFYDFDHATLEDSTWGTMTLDVVSIESIPLPSHSLLT